MSYVIFVNGALFLITISLAIKFVSVKNITTRAANHLSNSYRTGYENLFPEVS